MCAQFRRSRNRHQHVHKRVLDHSQPLEKMMHLHIALKLLFVQKACVCGDARQIEVCDGERISSTAPPAYKHTLLVAPRISERTEKALEGILEPEPR